MGATHCSRGFEVAALAVWFVQSRSDAFRRTHKGADETRRKASQESFHELRAIWQRRR